MSTDGGAAALQGAGPAVGRHCAKDRDAHREQMAEVSDGLRDGADVQEYEADSMDDSGVHPVYWVV